jgi:hypothetical protein
MPKAPEDSEAYFSRWIVIPFTQVFARGAPGTIPQRKLLAQMGTSQELSGLLNRALDAGDEVRTEGFFISETMREAARDLRRTTDPFFAWLEEHVVLVSAGVIPQKDLRNQYLKDCRSARPPRPEPLGKQVAAMVKRIYPTVEVNQKRSIGRRSGVTVAWPGWPRSQSPRGRHSNIRRKNQKNLCLHHQQCRQRGVTSADGVGRRAGPAALLSPTALISARRLRPVGVARRSKACRAAAYPGVFE